MKKQFIAASAAALMASPLAVMAGDLNIYGEAHLSVDHADDRSDSSQFIGNRFSHLGITGSEYLGMGLTGIFQYETTVEFTDGGDLFGDNTESFLGLQGGFGTLIGGQLDDPLFATLDGLDLFADRVGSVHTMARPDGAVSHNNVLAYVTPDFNGFSLSAVYGPEQGTDKGSRFVGQLDFEGEVEAGGTISASLGYLQANEGVVDPADPDSEDKLKIWQATFGYEMTDVWRGFAFYQDYSSSDEGTGLEDDKAYGAGVGFMVSPQVELLAQISHYDADDSDMRATTYALGADYFISDRTTLYGIFGMTRNKSDSSAVPTDVDYYASSGSEGISPDAGDNPWVLSLGVVHSF
ncbi:putative porin [Alkalispirillum mobile]|uniref:Putative porin n=1 Tax=Alkalispirillum mobile TaxID=85925 RepID=A0A498C9V3_9GAMM|nr:porin [Alkalispirillum mobile]RLK51156.1 putative porin [Alkalispirillum mobile]